MLRETYDVEGFVEMIYFVKNVKHTRKLIKGADCEI